VRDRLPCITREALRNAAKTPATNTTHQHQNTNIHMKRFFSHIGKTCRRSRNVSRGAATAKVRQEEAVGGTVVSVHRFQQGARDVLVDDGSRRTYVFIPSATPIRNIRTGETVQFRTVRSADTVCALSVA